MQNDENGLWKYKGVFFSKNGNLRKTVVTVVNNSMAGLSALEVGKPLGVALRTFLAQESKETVLECSICDGVHNSGELESLVTPWCNLGYDLLVYVGESIFLKHLNEKEVRRRYFLE